MTRYWRRKLTELTDVLDVAASLGSARLGVAGLRDLGARDSWYGFAEVRGRTMVRSSMAHMASLGRAAADSGVCDRWPDRVFRFSLDVSGIAGGEVPLFPSAMLISTWEKGRALARTLGAAAAVILRGNGRVVVGSSPAEACCPRHIPRGIGSA